MLKFLTIIFLSVPFLIWSIPTLSVRGVGNIEKPTDIMRIDIGIINEMESLDQAMQENNSSMQKLTANLQKTGVAKENMQTTGFSIYPVYSERPKDAPTNWHARIVGYRVRNQLSVSTERLDLGGKIIQSAQSSGANFVENIRFELKDPQKWRAEVIAAATQNALADAKSLSESAGIKLKQIISISLDDAQGPRPMPMMHSFAKMASNSAPLEEGQYRLSASVNVVYEIE